MTYYNKAFLALIVFALLAGIFRMWVLSIDVAMKNRQTQRAVSEIDPRVVVLENRVSDLRHACHIRNERIDEIQSDLNKLTLLLHEQAE